jgi:hypothetical protein
MAPISAAQRLFGLKLLGRERELGALGLGRSSSRWQTDVRFIYFLSSRRPICKMRCILLMSGSSRLESLAA